jgi:hypothetical protein
MSDSWADKAIEDMKASYEAELSTIRDRIEELVVERAVRLVNEDRYFFIKAEAAERKLAEARADALEEAAKVCESASKELVVGELPHGVCISLAAAIRALKSGGANG